MKHTIEIFLGIVAMLFLGWYLPVSYMNVFSCDDFWFGTNVHNYGFWGNQLFYWKNWEGSYTHTFLASLPHAFDGIKAPFLSNLLSLSCLFGSILLFYETFSKNSKRMNLISSLYILAFIYLFTNGICEIRFWVCANITYITECSIIIAVLSCYHKLKKTASRKNLFILCILVFLLAGTKINFIAYGIGAIVLHDIMLNNKPNRIVMLVYLTFFVFCCINVFAPGNYIRLAEETSQKNIAEQMSIAEILIFRFEKISLYPIYSLLLFPLVPYLKFETFISSKKIILGTVFVIAMFVIDSFLMFLCFNDPGPNRVYICAELSIIAYMMVVMYYIYVRWLKKEKIVAYLSWGCIITFAISNVLIYSEVLPSIEYSKQSTLRDNYVRQVASCEVIKMNPLPESHLLLSYFSNEEPWLENVYLPYFNKSGTVIITDADN